LKYLSLDLEATGLAKNDQIIEFAVVPFCAKKCEFEDSLTQHYFIQCPPFEELEPGLDPWVIRNNRTLIDKAHKDGLPMEEFKRTFQNYLDSKEFKKYFAGQKPVKPMLFGKSLNAIDLPFLNRDLGWDFMRTYFHHQVLDLSCVAHTLADFRMMPEKIRTGSELMDHLQMGEVSHTALEDARNTAIMYFKLVEKFNDLKN
jgi:DNA polymerase III epsilon subunit-like protein